MSIGDETSRANNQRNEQDDMHVGTTPLGISTWVWTSPLDDGSLVDLSRRVAGFGYDVLELPIENLGDWTPGRAADILRTEGLKATTCAVMSSERNLVAVDAATRSATQDYLRSCVDIAVAVGASVVAGPMYAPTGWVSRVSASDRSALIARLIEALKPVADYAGRNHVRLALEPLNRYETSLINTVEQAMDVVGNVQSPALGVCLDTFHLNIEEKDPKAAARAAGADIAHVQASGTDRGAPGADQFDWPGFADALESGGYSGPICVESFTGDNAAIARAASIWRPLAPSQDQLAIDGLAFLRSLTTRGASSV